jgi:hypothetical protein
MSILLSISFKDFSFRNEISKFILEKLKVKSIECNKDFEWCKINKKDIFDIDCNQIQFGLSNGGQIILQNMNNSFPRIYGGEIDFETMQIIKKKTEELYFELIVMGFVQPWIDSILQNTEEIKRWTRRNLSIPSYIQIIPNPNYIEGAPGMDMIVKEYLSIESLPGHIHHMNYSDMLSFGSCWQMYFSPLYYKYIPKSLWDGLENFYEHKIFKNGLRKVTLFENIDNFDNPENRALQWAFRRQLGIDSIAHELTKANNRIEPNNLPVLITKQNCEKGQTRVIRYLDKNDNLIASNLAVKKEIKEYLEDGITVVFEKIENL